MPKGTNQKLKLYRLAQIMLENTDDEHYITMPEIMEELGKYKKSITICAVCSKTRRKGFYGRYPGNTAAGVDCKGISYCNK